MAHKYRITVEALDSPARDSMQFDVENHDDILVVVEKMSGREEFSGDDAKAFGVGLKLFSEVMLKNKQAPLFANFIPHFVNFMKELKKR